LAGAFFAGAFLAAAFLAGAFFAGAFLAGAFFAVTFLAGAFLAVTFLAGAFFAVTFLAGAFFAAATFLAGAFFAVTFLAGAAFFATAFLLSAFLAVVFAAVVFLRDAAALTGAEARRTASRAAATACRTRPPLRAVEPVPWSAISAPLPDATPIKVTMVSVRIGLPRAGDKWARRTRDVGLRRPGRPAAPVRDPG
jgi:hypothetical protein